MFDKNDVIIVADALLTDCLEWDNQDYNYECIHCCGQATLEKENYKHDLDCPVLVAQDLLTK